MLIAIEKSPESAVEYICYRAEEVVDGLRFCFNQTKPSLAFDS